MGFEIRGCPKCTVDKTPEVYAYMRWYKFYEKGHLPFSGTVADQPATLIQAFELIGEIHGRRKQA